MPALMGPRPKWRTHPQGAGYIRTAIAADKSVLIETFLADKASPGTGGPQRHYRIVVIPASVAASVVAGLAADLEAGGER